VRGSDPSRSPCSRPTQPGSSTIADFGPPTSSPFDGRGGRTRARSADALPGQEPHPHWGRTERARDGVAGLDRGCATGRRDCPGQYPAPAYLAGGRPLLQGVPTRGASAGRRAHPTLLGTPRPALGRLLANNAALCFGRAGDLGRVRAPTLVIHGGADAITPPENALRLAQGIPGAVLHIEPGAGHAVLLERSGRTAAILVRWVAERTGDEPAARRPLGRLTERVSRPFALHLGALRNTKAVVTTSARHLHSALAEPKSTVQDSTDPSLPSS